jgi:hypothetical protein
MSQSSQPFRRKFQNGQVYLDRRDIEMAIANSKSNSGAARYLGVSLVTYRKAAKKYQREDGQNLYDSHNNCNAVGIPKYSTRLNKKVTLMDILEGVVDKSFTSMKDLKPRIIAEGYMREECSRCAFKEKRVLDQKVPLIVNYLDNNKRNWRLDNLEFLCYNCYFLYIGDVFLKKQIEAMEDVREIPTTPIDFELPKIIEQDVKNSINLENRLLDNRFDNFGDDLIVSVKKGRNG